METVRKRCPHCICVLCSPNFRKQTLTIFKRSGGGGRGVGGSLVLDPPLILYPSSPQNYNYTLFKFSENEYLTKARSCSLTLWHVCTLFSDNKPSQSSMAVVGCVLFLVRLPERLHVIDLNVRDNHAYCQRMDPRFF